VDKAPDGFVVTLDEATRTNAQNDLMWVLLSDLSIAKPEGRSHPPKIWKCVFMDALPGDAFKALWVPSLDGESVVNTGHRSSKLTKAQMSDLIESIYAYGAEHGVRWTDQEAA
jgi:hypothetical protein